MASPLNFCQRYLDFNKRCFPPADPYCQKILADRERAFAALEQVNVARLAAKDRVSYLEALLLPVGEPSSPDLRTKLAIEDLYGLGTGPETFIDQQAWQEAARSIESHAAAVREAQIGGPPRGPALIDSIARALMISLGDRPVPVEFHSGPVSKGNETNAYYCPSGVAECGTGKIIVVSDNFMSQAREDQSKALEILFEEAYHHHQKERLKPFCSGEITRADPFFGMHTLNSLNSLYQPSVQDANERGPRQSYEQARAGLRLERAYLHSPLESFAKKFARRLAEVLPCTPDKFAGAYDSGYGPIECRPSLLGARLSCRYGDGLRKTLDLELEQNGRVLVGRWAWEPGTRQRGSAQFAVTKSCGIGNGSWGYGSPSTYPWPVAARRSTP